MENFTFKFKNGKFVMVESYNALAEVDEPEATEAPSAETPSAASAEPSTSTGEETSAASEPASAPNTVAKLLKSFGLSKEEILEVYDKFKNWGTNVDGKGTVIVFQDSKLKDGLDAEDSGEAGEAGEETPSTDTTEPSAADTGSTASPESGSPSAGSDASTVPDTSASGAPVDRSIAAGRAAAAAMATYRERIADEINAALDPKPVPEKIKYIDQEIDRVKTKLASPEVSGSAREELEVRRTLLMRAKDIVRREATVTEQFVRPRRVKVFKKHASLSGWRAR